MIAFSHADPRFPFLREFDPPVSGRWNVEGEPSICFCDTPDGAWAEFLRHEEIRDAEELPTIRRALWAVDIGERPTVRPRLEATILTGGPESWDACRSEAQRLRTLGSWGISAPSAALRPGAARGRRVDDNLEPGPKRDGRIFVFFRRRRHQVGWVATPAGRPGVELLALMRHFRGTASG